MSALTEMLKNESNTTKIEVIKLEKFSENFKFEPLETYNESESLEIIKKEVLDEYEDFTEMGEQSEPILGEYCHYNYSNKIKEEHDVTSSEVKFEAIGEICDFNREELGPSLVKPEEGASKIPGFVCCYCDFTASSLPDLSRHEKFEHYETKTFPCKICSKIFKKVNCLKTHFYNHKWYKSQKCDLCSFVAPSYICLRKHMKQKHLEKPTIKYKCPFCKEKFDKRCRQVAHSQKVHKKNRQVCTMVTEDSKIEAMYIAIKRKRDMSSNNL